MDEIIVSIGSLLFDYQTLDGGIVQLREVRDVDLRHLVVADTEPIPPKIPLLAADALNELRATIEHVVYIEAEYFAGEELDSDTARQIEMPAKVTYASFTAWTKKMSQNGPEALKYGSALHKRIYNLQPFQRYKDPQMHPLARLVAYTNHAKHRTPAVMAVRFPSFLEKT